MDDWMESLVSNDESEAAVADTTELYAEGELFAKHITPEPAEEGPPEWMMAEESDDDGDGTLPHADADEPKPIDMPPAAASAPPMSNLERCIALRLVYGAGPRWVKKRSVPHVRPHMCPARLPRHMLVLIYILPSFPDTCLF